MKPLEGNTGVQLVQRLISANHYAFVPEDIPFPEDVLELGHLGRFFHHHQQGVTLLPGNHHPRHFHGQQTRGCHYTLFAALYDIPN
jgi:hypothetical protein